MLGELKYVWYNPGMKNLKLGLLVGSATIVGGLGSAVLFNGVAHGEWDLPGLNQQVQHVTEVTTNHEARISNLETQVNTPVGQPTPTPVVVTKVVTVAAPAAPPVTQPSVLTAQATPTPVPVPTVVKSVGLGCMTDNHVWYRYIYSDGTSKDIVDLKSSCSSSNPTNLLNP